MRFFMVSLTAVLFTVALWSDTMVSLSDTIEKARSQSVLTQKMLADYVMIGMHNNFQGTEENFQKNIKKFEKNIEDLDAFTTSKKAFKNIEKITTLWDTVKPILLEKKDQQKAMILYDKLSAMLMLTKETTEIYTRQTGSMLGKIIDASADIGINAQKMATLYLLKAWEIKDETVEAGMKHALERFSKSLEMLKKAKVNTEEIRKQLKKIGKASMYFSVMDTLGSTAIPTLIYRKSDIILKDANTLSALYNKSITLN